MESWKVTSTFLTCPKWPSSRQKMDRMRELRIDAYWYVSFQFDAANLCKYCLSIQVGWNSPDDILGKEFWTWPTPRQFLQVRLAPLYLQFNFLFMSTSSDTWLVWWIDWRERWRCTMPLPLQCIQNQAWPALNLRRRVVLLPIWTTVKKQVNSFNIIIIQ